MGRRPTFMLMAFVAASVALAVGCTPSDPGVPTTTVPSQPAVVDVAVGHDHSCAVVEDGRVFCWGANDHGELGDGTLDDSPTPVLVSGIGPARSVEVSGESSAVQGRTACAVLDDGTLACWGSGGHGQLGTGDYDDSSTAQPVQGLDDVVEVALGDSHTCALIADGTMRCWGSNSLYGPVGVGQGDSFPTPQIVPDVVDAVAVAAGGYNSCAVISDGSLKCWGSNHSGQMGTPPLFNSPDSSARTPRLMPVTAPVVGVDVEGGTVCAAHGDQGATCWGSSQSRSFFGFPVGGGMLGDATRTDSHVPVSVTGVASATDVQLGAVGCANVGGQVPSCWGGKWPTTDFLVGVDTSVGAGMVLATPLHEVGPVVDLGVGAHHACAVSDGQLRCWGFNDRGQLGDGSGLHVDLNDSAPVQVLLPA